MTDQRTGAKTTGSGAAPDPLAMLEDDHRHAERLLDRLADAEGEEAENLVAALREALDLHMELEEDLLYPVVRAVVGDEDADEAEAEHALARTGLDELEERLGQPGFDAAVEMVRAGIRHHVTEEEGTVFPRLREEGGSRLADLAVPMAQARASFEAAMAGRTGDDPDTDGQVDGEVEGDDGAVVDLTDNRRQRADRGRRRRAERASSRAGTGPGGLAAMSKADLLERAKAADVKGRSSMTKDELVAALGRA